MPAGLSHREANLDTKDVTRQDAGWGNREIKVLSVRPMLIQG